MMALKVSTPVFEKQIPAKGSTRANASLASSVSFFAAFSKRSTLFLAGVTALLIATDVHASTGSVSVGQRVTLSVSAQGTAPFTYQWYKNGAALSGGASASYIIDSATINDTANYSAVVRNSSGSTVSDVASLTVVPIVITPPPSPNTVTDPGFESVRVGVNDFYAFQYNPVISNWTFAGAAGIAGNNSGFTSSNSASPEGSQVAFVQTQGSATVRLTLSAGRYAVSAMVANRANYGGSQTVLVYVDGAQVGSFSGGTSFTWVTTNAFNVGDGTHDIRFGGSVWDDSTLFLDQVNVAPVSVAGAVASSGFESPNAGSDDFYAFRYNPQFIPGTQDWIFSGYSGVTGNNTGFTSQNPNAPEGRQVAFLQMNNSVVTQTISVPASSTYQLTVLAAQRANYNVAEQLVQIYIDNVYVGTIVPHGGAYQSFTFPFTATGGSHRLDFKGIVSSDSTVFLDRVTIQ